MIYFVSRHAGAVEWAKRKGIVVDQLVSHFDPEVIQEGDIVIGTLPINIVAIVNEKGGIYKHLSLDLPAEARGKELTADDMDAYGAKLQTFSVSSPDFANSEVLVGQWDDIAGEYGPERQHSIVAETTIQGHVVKLSSSGVDQRDVYIERVKGSWRINVSMDLDDVNLVVWLRDDGTIDES